MTPQAWHLVLALLYALLVWWFVRLQRRGKGDNPLAALIVAVIGGVALYTALEIRAPLSEWQMRRPKYRTLLDPAGWLIMVISVGVSFVFYGAIAGWSTLNPPTPEERAQMEAEARAMRIADGEDVDAEMEAMRKEKEKDEEEEQEDGDNASPRS